MQHRTQKTTTALLYSGAVFDWLRGQSVYGARCAVER